MSRVLGGRLQACNSASRTPQARAGSDAGNYLLSLSYCSVGDARVYLYNYGRALINDGVIAILKMGSVAL